MKEEKILRVEDLRPGDVLEWDAINGPVRGVVDIVDVKGGLVDREAYIFMPNGSAFRAVNIVSGRCTHVKLVRRVKLRECPVGKTE